MRAMRRYQEIHIARKRAPTVPMSRVFSRNACKNACARLASLLTTALFGTIFAHRTRREALHRRRRQFAQLALVQFKDAVETSRQAAIVCHQHQARTLGAVEF